MKRTCRKNIFKDGGKKKMKINVQSDRFLACEFHENAL